MLSSCHQDVVIAFTACLDFTGGPGAVSELHFFFLFCYFGRFGSARVNKGLHGAMGILLLLLSWGAGSVVTSPAVLGPVGGWKKHGGGGCLPPFLPYGGVL